MLVSGEHCIGFAKKAYMIDQLGYVYVGLIKNIKLAFDLKNILNPGKVCEYNKLYRQCLLKILAIYNIFM